jgi:phosphoribosylformylglycinamidine cyclo-ligase
MGEGDVHERITGLRAGSSPARPAYAAAGVDVDAAERAVELMRARVIATHGPEVLDGIGGFA